MPETKTAVGYSNEQDAFLLGRNLAESTLKDGPVERTDLAIAFCGGQVDHDRFFKGLQSIVGNEVPVIGGSTIGIITNGDLSYKGFPAGLALIQSNTVRLRVAAADDLDKGEQRTGRKLARMLGKTLDDKMLLVFYDSVRIPATEAALPVLNASVPLLEGIDAEFETYIPVLGAGLIGDYGFGPTKQFCGSYTSNGTVVGTMLSGNCHFYYCIMHGCSPLDGIYHTITKMDGSILYELDGKPIVDIIDDIFGDHGWRTKNPVDHLTIGLNCGERYGEPEESKYVNRLITGITPDGRAVRLFEPDFRPGMEVQFMLRDTGKMLESAKKNSESLLKRIEGESRKPVFGLYIDCAGRTAEYSNTLYEEASYVQEVFKRYGIPLLGFYSGVEICPLLKKNRGLDWTGVLMVLAEET